MTRPRSDARLVLGIALLAVAAALAWFPPRAMPLVGPAPDAGLLARLFPGVPGAWVALRLALLAAGALLAGRALPAAFPGWLPRAIAPAPADAAPAPGRSWLGLALAVALAQLVLLVFVPRLGRTGQGVYVALLFVPPLLLAFGQRLADRRDGAPAEGARGTALGGAALLAGWLLWRIPASLHSPRTADSIDTWLNFQWFLDAIHDGSNLLLEGAQPGVTNLYLVLLGAPLLGPGRIAPSFPWMQIVNGLGVVLAAERIAWIARRTSGPASAWIAATAFSFSPFMLSMTYVATPFGVGCALIAWIVSLALSLHRRASAAALAGLGTLAGVATAIPQVAPVALAAGIGVALFALRGPRLPRAAWSIPIASFLAAGLPGLPTPSTLRAMHAEYIAKCAQWTGIERVLLGQRSPWEPPDAADLWYAGRPGPLDVPLGALLAPWATPRTALRLWGDVYLEPLSSALALLAIVVCVRALRRERAAALPLLLLAVAVAPGFTSAYDRASLTRAIAVPVAIALLAGAGFEALRARLRLARPGRVAALACAAVALSGVFLFDRLNPRIVPASSNGIALRVLEAGAPSGGALLLAPEFDWLHVERIARWAPRRPLPSRRYDGPESLLAAPSGDAPAAEVLFYSPALEVDQRIEHALCARWPGAALYRFSDRSGLSKVLAARPEGAGGWTPAWPADRLERLGCRE